MGLPLPEETCLELTIDIQALLDLSIDLPGGVSLQAQLEVGQFPNLSVIVGALISPLNAALTPLMPIFRILDVVIALIEFSKAVPDALGPPPDPTVIIKKLKKLLKAAAKLTSLFPPLSIPIMIVGICKTVAAALLALIEQLEHMLVAQASLDLARGRAATLAANPLLLAGAARLEASIDCAQIDLDLALSLSASGLGPLNKLIDLINLFCDLAKLPRLISLEATGDASGMLAPLRAAVEALSVFCNSIPTNPADLIPNPSAVIATPHVP